MYDPHTSLIRLCIDFAARFQLIIPDVDRDRFVHQARREGLSLSAWLRRAAKKQLDEQQMKRPFESIADLDAFFEMCDTLDGPDNEPEWLNHLEIIGDSRRRGTTST